MGFPLVDSHSACKRSHLHVRHRHITAHTHGTVGSVFTGLVRLASSVAPFIFVTVAVVVVGSLESCLVMNTSVIAPLQSFGLGVLPRQLSDAEAEATTSKASPYQYPDKSFGPTLLFVVLGAFWSFIGLFIVCGNLWLRRRKRVLMKGTDSPPEDSNGQIASQLCEDGRDSAVWPLTGTPVGAVAEI
eukprot:TRINITY_DN5146_c0_g1_i1.p1 TRINITY_DN5146_c0_g1~~TRINITY_DN5146_c0_g1_i1.p1  ORF type:complete len:187 (-),score=15.88 TRINITY_DN5146_c0_g1_i1:58-618(-)